MTTPMTNSVEIDVLPVKPKAGLKKDQIEKFQTYIINEIKDTLRKRKPREEQWETNVQMYNARLKRKDAGEQDADMDYTMTLELAEQAKARLVNPIMSYSQIFYPTERRREFAELAKGMEEFSNWIEDQTDWLTLQDEFVTQMQVFGPAFVKVVFERKVVKTKSWDVDELGQSREVEQEVVTVEGPTPRVVHTPNMLFPDGCGEVLQDVDWIAERFYMTNAEIFKLEKQKIFKKGFSKHSATSSGEDPRFKIGGNEKETTVDNHKLRELWEVYTKLPTDEEVVMVVDVDNGEVGRFVYNWLHWDFKPYVNSGWKKRTGTIDATSLMELLEGTHRAYQAIMNMTLDAGSRALEKLLIGSIDLGLMKYFKNGKLVTGFIETEATPEELAKGLREIKVSDGFTSMTQLLDRIVGHGHNVASIPAAYFGEEVAERPTAHGTDQVLTEARQPLNFMLERYRRALAKIHMMQFARYRQYFPRGCEYYVKTSDSMGQLVWQTMKWPEGVWQQQVAFEVRCSSQNASRDTRRKQIMAMLQQVPAAMQGLVQMGAMATQANPTAPVAVQAMSVMSNVVKEFLEEFDIEGADKFAPMEGVNIGKNFGMAMQQMQGKIQSLQRQLAKFVPPQPPKSAGPGLSSGAQGVPGMGGGSPMG